MTPAERERNDTRSVGGIIQSRYIGIGNYPRSGANGDDARVLMTLKFKRTVSREIWYNFN